MSVRTYKTSVGSHAQSRPGSNLHWCPHQTNPLLPNWETVLDLLPFIHCSWDHPLACPQPSRPRHAPRPKRIDCKVTTLQESGRRLSLSFSILTEVKNLLFGSFAWMHRGPPCFDQVASIVLVDNRTSPCFSAHPWKVLFFLPFFLAHCLVTLSFNCLCYFLFFCVNETQPLPPPTHTHICTPP